MQANRSALRAAGAAVIALGLLAVACGSSQSTQSASNKQAQSSTPSTLTAAKGYNPHIDPKNFVKKIDNPFFPLKPGTKYELRSRTGDGVGHETLTVTHDTKKIARVTTTVIKDVSTLDGKLGEKTTD